MNWRLEADIVGHDIAEAFIAATVEADVKTQAIQDQVQALKSAVETIIPSLGDASRSFKVVAHGWANDNHAPIPGKSTDYIMMHIAQV